MGTGNDGPRILFIDSYDSFTHNLAALCRQAIPGCQIHIIKNDALTIDQLLQHIPSFTAIIVGPGPGSPENACDIGIVRDLWRMDERHRLPIFGVCLGLQSLAIENGASIQRLSVVKHGQISPIQHTGLDLFRSIGQVQAVRYHSLHVKIPANADIEVLAWADDGEENGKVVMALKHKTKPFWAVQYHAESVKTIGGGVEVMRNFWCLAKNWNKLNRREDDPWSLASEAVFGASWPSLCANPPTLSLTNVDKSPRKVITKVLRLAHVTSIKVAELFGATKEAEPAILLDSAAQPGRYSIIASLSASSCKISYYLGDEHVLLSQDGVLRREFLGGQSIWAWTADFMATRRAHGGHKEVPFWGGLVGYLSYELGCAGLEKRHLQLPESNRNYPDVNFMFVERSVVIDNQEGKVYIQSIIPKDEPWIKATTNALIDSIHVPPTDENSLLISKVAISLPDRDRYLSRIRIAKEHLSAGNSYELCLTAQTSVTVSRLAQEQLSNNDSSSWELYKTLRRKNPAPYSAYLRLHPSTILSSSPERFLSFSRPPSSTFQLRPIKGTLRKALTITRADAELNLAGNVKEVAENLMIVDLIRHDLHGVVGENVNVTQFCGIEEYETVWQMVSVIEGKAPPPTPARKESNNAGWDVLRHCLPPGSMTGAPKKRSVEILRELEDGPRGIYSGVLGYWDVGGGGDWAVVIRSCFKHDASSVSQRSEGDDNLVEQWTMGAGGAITALSDPCAEWDEMVLKLKSVLGIFEPTHAHRGMEQL